LDSIGNKKEPEKIPALFQLVDCMELIYILQFYTIAVRTIYYKTKACRE